MHCSNQSWDYGYSWIPNVEGTYNLNKEERNLFDFRFIVTKRWQQIYVLTKKFNVYIFRTPCGVNGGIFCN